MEFPSSVYSFTVIPCGGVNTGIADGTKNLEQDGGKETWRQGYSDLPDVTSGSNQYMAI
mgnify:CR=1 FL=1